MSDPIVRILVEQLSKHVTKISSQYVLAGILYKHKIHMPETHIKITDSLIKGGTTKSIAQSLRMSENTIRKYISDWIKAVNMNNRNEVIDFLKQFFDGYKVT